MKKIWAIAVVLLMATLACSGFSGGNRGNGAGGSASGGAGGSFAGSFDPAPADLGTLIMSLEDLGPFRASFVITFEGRRDYTYQVDTRYDGKQVEYDLKIEGVDADQDPGDVRLVNRDGVNRMRGAGTDRQCIQFPDEFETAALFLNPLDLIDLDAFSQDWADDGGTIVANRPATSFSAEEKTYAGWQDVSVTYVLDRDTDALLQFEFEAEGLDPLFDGGKGRIQGLFEVLEVGSQTIEPVKGCQVDFPLPDDASQIIVFPGLVVFETGLGPIKLDTFYRQELVAELGWQREEPVTGENRESLLSYFTEGRRLDMHLEALNPEDFNEGFKVEVFIEAN